MVEQNKQEVKQEESNEETTDQPVESIGKGKEEETEEKEKKDTEAEIKAEKPKVVVQQEDPKEEEAPKDPPAEEKKPETAEKKEESNRETAGDKKVEEKTVEDTPKSKLIHRNKKESKAGKEFVQVINSVRSPKTGAYSFPEAFLHKNDVNDFIKGDQKSVQQNQSEDGK